MPFKSILRAAGEFLRDMASPPSGMFPPTPPTQIQQSEERPMDWRFRTHVTPDIADGSIKPQSSPFLDMLNALGALRKERDWYAGKCVEVDGPDMIPPHMRGTVHGNADLPPHDLPGTISDMTDLIERQEAAEAHVRSMGFIWDRGKKIWRCRNSFEV